MEAQHRHALPRTALSIAKNILSSIARIHNTVDLYPYLHEKNLYRELHRATESISHKFTPLASVDVANPHIVDYYYYSGDYMCNADLTVRLKHDTRKVLLGIVEIEGATGGDIPQRLLATRFEDDDWRFFYVPPLSLRDALFFSMNPVILDRLVELQVPETMYAELLKMAIEKLSGKVEMGMSILESARDRYKSRVGKAYGEFDLIVGLNTLKTVGIRAFILEGDSDPYYLYTASFNYEGTEDTVYSRDAYGLELILAFIVPEAELRTAERVLRAIEKSIAIAPLLFEAVWRAIHSLKGNADR